MPERAPHSPGEPGAGTGCQRGPSQEPLFSLWAWAVQLHEVYLSAGAMPATMPPPEAINPSLLPPVANSCRQTICTTSFGPAWQEKVELLAKANKRVTHFDGTRLHKAVGLTIGLPVGPMTPSDELYATIRI